MAATGNWAAGQIARFARRWVGERIGLSVDKKRSPSEQAVVLAKELVEYNKLSEGFFDALEKASPRYKDLIDLARRAWREERGSGAVSKDPVETEGHKSASVQEGNDPWLDDLNAALEEAAFAQPRPPQTWIDAAALLPSFDPRDLKHVPVGEEDYKGNALVTMASLVEPGLEGDWVLKREVRRRAVARMDRECTLPTALEGAARLDPSQRHALYLSLLRDIAEAGTIEIGVDDPRDRLIAAQVIASWFQEASRRPVNVDRLSVILEARDNMEPLRKLVGKHFRGRDRELATLAASAGSEPDQKRVLALTGIGGSGKSALIGRYILSLLEQSGPTRPFAYLDFDRSEFDPGNPRKLIERICRNLGLLYAGTPGSRRFYNLEAVSARDPEFELVEWVVKGNSDEDLLRSSETPSE